MELGVFSFGDLPQDGSLSPRQRLNDLLEEAELADQVGLDVFGAGEHHRADYPLSAPAVFLAAASQRTKRVRLTSAVTVLSSDDPVRVLEEFATVDNLSGGRAEIIAGRGSFVESFPLFGYDLNDYESLFEEKLALLVRLRDEERVTWFGHHRAALKDATVYPRPAQDRLPIWVGVGGTPRSVVRAAARGLPMALAIIGGDPRRFKPFADLYREASREAGHDPSGIPMAVTGIGYVAPTSQQAADEFFPSHKASFDQIGRERGWGSTSRAQYDAAVGLHGALHVGSPRQVADRLLMARELFDNSRFIVSMPRGSLSHAQVMRSIELLGTEVAPVLRREAARALAAA